MRPLAPSPHLAWKLFGWFGAGLVVIGLADMLIAAYPFRPGNPDWEFGVIHQITSILPLPTIGLAAILASGFAQGKRRMVRCTAIALLLLAATIVALGFVFVTVVPLALKAVPVAILPGVQKAIARSAVAGVLFPLLYLAAGVAAWRYSRPPNRSGVKSLG